MLIDTKIKEPKEKNKINSKLVGNGNIGTRRLCSWEQQRTTLPPLAKSCLAKTGLLFALSAVSLLML